MSEQIREQVSAFLDGELPNTETELLLKRLTRDGELRESFGRYALIGEALRGDGCHRCSATTRDFSWFARSFCADGTECQRSAEQRCGRRARGALVHGTGHIDGYPGVPVAWPIDELCFRPQQVLLGARPARRAGGPAHRRR